MPVSATSACAQPSCGPLYWSFCTEDLSFRQNENNKYTVHCAVCKREPSFSFSRASETPIQAGAQPPACWLKTARHLGALVSLSLRGSSAAPQKEAKQKLGLSELPQEAEGELKHIWKHLQANSQVGRKGAGKGDYSPTPPHKTASK